jgi:hypothetical protein
LDQQKRHSRESSIVQIQKVAQAETREL